MTIQLIAALLIGFGAGLVTGWIFCGLYVLRGVRRWQRGQQQRGQVAQ